MTGPLHRNIRPSLTDGERRMFFAAGFGGVTRLLRFTAAQAKCSLPGQRRRRLPEREHSVSGVSAFLPACHRYAICRLLESHFWENSTLKVWVVSCAPALAPCCSGGVKVRVRVPASLLMLPVAVTSMVSPGLTP